MIKLLFLSHTKSCETPMAEFIMDSLIQERDLAAHISIDSACIEGNGLPLSLEGQEVLESRGIPCTMKKAFPLAWKTYDEYTFILLMDEDSRPYLFNILGGDVDEKIHLLSEYAGGERNISNPYQDGSFEKAFEEEMEGCRGLVEKLEDWVR